MGLIDTSELMAVLVCPRCHANLMFEAGSYRCTNQSCVYSPIGSFPTTGTWPILIDFERSILDKHFMLATSASSVVARIPVMSLRKRFKNYLLPPNSVAPKNIASLINMLKQRTDRPVVLEIGGGTVGTASQPLHDDPAIRLISFDVYASTAVQFIADGHQIPLADHSVDAVVIQAVLEHVLDPWQIVSEIYRVLRDDGFVYSEIPFMQQVHEGPYDFTRFTQSGHRYLYKRFQLIDSGVVGGSGTQLLWTIEHLARGLFRSRAIGRIMKFGFFWLRYLDNIIPEKYAIDNASATFFLGQKAEHAISPQEMPLYYNGAG